MAGESRNALAEWKQRVLETKFNLGIPSHEVFVRAKESGEVLERFFSPNDYAIKQSGSDKDNYLLYLLVSSQMKDIHLINEMSQLIKHSYLSSHNFAFKSKSGIVNHAGLSNVLFEVFVDKYLNSSGIATIPNVMYIDRSGQEKPLDNFFKFNENNYLVECCRVSDVDSVNIMLLIESIMRLFVKTPLCHYQNFIAHVGFKTDKNISKTISRVKAHIRVVYKKYLHAFNVVGDNSINIPGRFVSDEYDMDISPIHMGKSHNKEMAENQYTSLISVRIDPKGYQSKMGRLIIEGKRYTLEDNINKNLFDKVKRKLDQHSDYEGNKIFFIEIDLTFGVNPNNPIFVPIRQNQVDVEPYKKIVKENPNIIFVFVFKSATYTGIDREYRILHDASHQSLVNVFQGNYHYLLNTRGFMSQFIHL